MALTHCLQIHNLVLPRKVNHMRIEHRTSIRSKRRFILFTPAVHQILIEEGSTNIKCLGYIPDKKELSIISRGLKGFALKKDTVRGFDENDKLIPVYDQEIWQYHWIPDDPSDPINSHIKMKDTTGLKRKAKKKSEKYNEHRGLASMKIAPLNVKITEADIEYPIYSERVTEMYNHQPRFYLCLGTGYHKEHFRKTGYTLFKRLQATQSKKPRFLNSAINK